MQHIDSDDRSSVVSLGDGQDTSADMDAILTYVDDLVLGKNPSSAFSCAEFSDGVTDNGTVQHPLLHYPVDIFTPVECLRAAKHLIHAHQIGNTGLATHTLLWPGEPVNASMRQYADCVSLYTLLGHGKEQHTKRVGLMEHTVSYVSRLSLVIHYHSPPSTTVSETDILTVAKSVHGYLVERERGKLQQSQEPQGVKEPACMLLRRGDNSGTFQMHWPNVCLMHHDLTRLSDELTKMRRICCSVTSGRISSVTIRGSTGMTPMYGSTARQDEEPFLFWRWLYEDDDSVYPLHLNLGSHGQYVVTNENIHLALPFLYSMNPIASCVTPWHWRDIDPDIAAWQLLNMQDPSVPRVASSFYETDEHAWDRQVDVVRQLLCIICGRSVSRQMEIGLHVHGALHGGWIGFCLWVNWVDQTLAGDSGGMGPWYEYYSQWQRFGWGSKESSPLRMLHSFAQSDNPSRFRLFLAAQRRMDHPNRDLQGGDDSLIQLFGSLHHLDIARFLRHEVHDDMVCVSTSRPSQWYIYQKDDHRWHYDGDGPSCTLRCYKLISAYVNQARQSATTGGGERGKGKGGGGSVTYMVNFPDDFEPSDVSRQTLVHLEKNIGDIRHMQCVMKAMMLFLHNPGFLSNLDTRNDHVIPFTNGVLDLKYGCLRPGIPQDMVSKGPTYTWHDHTAEQVVEIERILTTIFPDSTLREFFLQVGASLLRKRNRYKHFYVLSGNTNGGKSFLMSIFKQAFGSLFTQMPVTAITCRESDPSNHSDYLYRTAGCNVAVMHEPDSTTQRILPDRVKALTSDSDEVSCRPIFGQAMTMSIPWKLFLLCNTIPPLANVDAATVERLQVIPFLSTFSSAGVPTTEVEQFAARLFVANRNYNVDKVEELGRQLMGVLFATYQRNAMHSSSYTLRVPRQIRLGVEKYMRDVSLFRIWCHAFLRPTTPLCKRNTFMPRHLDYGLQSISAEVGRYIRQVSTSGVHHHQWWVDLTEASRQCMTPGSQGWVHAKCCEMWQIILRGVRWGAGLDQNMSKGKLGIAAVDLTTVVDTFNAFRSKNRLGQELCSSKNTADTSVPNPKMQRNSHRLRTSLPMDLDIGLVSQVVREVVGREAYDSLQLGVILITDQDQTSYTETDQIASAMVEDALLSCAARWERTYGIPIPHVGLVDPSVLRNAAQDVRVCNQGQRVNLEWDRSDIERILDEHRNGSHISAENAQTDDDHTNPVLNDNPATWDEACQLIQTANLYTSSTLSDLEQAARITRFESGFSKVEQFRASQVQSRVQEEDETIGPSTFVGSFYDKARDNGSSNVENSPAQLCHALHKAIAIVPTVHAECMRSE